MVIELGVAAPKASSPLTKDAHPVSAPAPMGIPAVVVGGSLNALGVVRSLAVGGMPVHVLETSRRWPAVWSRGVHYHPVPAHEGRAFIDALIGVGRQLG